MPPAAGGFGWARIHFSLQRDQKGGQNFPARFYLGYSFDIQSFLENYPLLSLACEHRCIFCCGENLATTRNMSVFTGYHFVEYNK